MSKQLKYIKSRLGYGCSSLMGRLTRTESLRLLACAYEHGIRHFDTARSYGYGEAESVLGEFVKGKRENVSITTKVGFLPPSGGSALQFARAIARKVVNYIPITKTAFRKWAASMVRKPQLSPSFIRSSVLKSLQELRTDYVDILLLHECEIEDLRQPELVVCLEQLKKEGLFITYGIGSDPVKTQKIVSRAISSLNVIQTENNPHVRSHLWNKDTASSLVITHRALGAAYQRVQHKIKQDAHAQALWSKEFDLQLSQPEVLARLFLGYALLKNNQGGVLFSARKEERIKMNAHLLGNCLMDEDQALLLEKLHEWALCSK